MVAVLAAASYSRIGFSPYLAVHARRVMVPCGSAIHMEPGKILRFTHLSTSPCTISSPYTASIIALSAVDDYFFFFFLFLFLGNYYLMRTFLFHRKHEIVFFH